MRFLENLNEDELMGLIIFNTFKIEHTDINIEIKEQLSRRVEYLIQLLDEKQAL